METALNEASETFVIYMVSLKVFVSIIIVYPGRKLLLAALEEAKAPIEVLMEYYDFANIFSSNLTIELPDCIGINEHTIKLVEEKLPPYSSIYSPSSVEFKTLKMYI